GSAPARSSTSSRAGSAATWRPSGSTTSVPRTAYRCGVAGCWRPASAGPRTWPSRHCPASPCPATRPAPTGTSAPTSPRRSCWPTVSWPYRPGPGSGSSRSLTCCARSPRQRSTCRRTRLARMGPRVLRQVLDDLGATLLELLAGDADRKDDIGGVAIHDPLDEPVLPEHALVLGVGLRDPEEIARLLVLLGRSEAVALVVRSPLTPSPELVAAAQESGVCLLALTPGASWAQLAALLRALLAEGDVGDAEPETLGGMPSGDLFALANAVASLLDAPVTIEDRSSRVLAFSGRQEEADQSRVETILGRQVPERYTTLLTERGVFRDLYRSDQPVYVEPPGDPLSDFSVPRVAVAVRAGDVVLGSIW